MTGKHSGPTTHLSLLLRLKNPTDSAAWEEFYGIYRPIVVRWCRRSIKNVDAEDVAQEILVRLIRHMKVFEYDPNRSFYAYLRTVTRRATIDFWRSHQRQLALGRTNLETAFEQMSYEPMEREMAEVLYQDYLPKAEAVVREHSSPDQWECYACMEHRDERAKEVSRRLGMEIAAVYKAVSRVRRSVRIEVKKMLGSDGIETP